MGLQFRAKLVCLSAIFSLVAAGLTVANAQSLDQPSPLVRLSDVVQFGVPRDTKFVFCEADECPVRSIKHLYVPSPSSTPQPLIEAPPIPGPITLPAELSRAKVQSTTNKKKLVKRRKKPVVQYECKPVAKER